MTTYKDLRQHYLGVKKDSDDKERIAKTAKDEASKCRAALLNYGRKQLRACEKAGLLILKENTPNKKINTEITDIMEVLESSNLINSDKTKKTTANSKRICGCKKIFIILRLAFPSCAK